MAKPFITAVIDTYNQERFIEQAVTSVLEQDVSPAEMEVLVVDDGSTDSTAAIVRKFAPRVRLITKQNGGQASAFNAAIPEARGEIVAFLDGDDWWAPSKLRKVVEALESDSEVCLVGHGITEVYPDGRQHTEVLREVSRFAVDSVEGSLHFRLRKSFLGTSRMTLRAELLRRILPVPQALKIEADEYLFTLAAASAPVRILPEALTFYRIHEANLYQVSGFHEECLRRKQKILACLAEELSHELSARGLPERVVDTVTEVVAVEANQLRLSLDGGRPWETVETEMQIYRIMHESASLSQRAFRYASLLPALLLPPQMFYRARRWLAGNHFYLGVRRALLPAPQPGHVERSWRSGS